MANTSVQVGIPSSGVLTLELFPAAGGAIANGVGGDAVTRDGDNASLGVATVTQALTGVHYYTLVDASSNIIAFGETEVLADTTATFKCHDIMPGSATSISTADIASIVAGVTAVSDDIASPLNVNKILKTEGDQWQIVITDLGTLANRTNLQFVMKHNRNDPDSKAVLWVDETTGLIRLQGTAWATAADATLVVDDASNGDITITVKSVATKKIKKATYADGLKIFRTTGNGGDLTYRPKGETLISEGPVDATT